MDVRVDILAADSGRVTGKPEVIRWIGNRGTLGPGRNLASQKGRPISPHALERLREPVLQEFAQFGRRLELRDRLQLLERRCERV